MPRPVLDDLDLLLPPVVAIATLAVVARWPGSPLRPILGLLFVAIVPGYAVVAALFPARPRIAPGAREAGEDARTPSEAAGGDMLVSERVVLSIATSVALVILAGMTLNTITPGLDVDWVVRGLTVLTFLGCGLAWIRRRLASGP